MLDLKTALGSAAMVRLSFACPAHAPACPVVPDIARSVVRRRSPGGCMMVLSVTRRKAVCDKIGVRPHWRGFRMAAPFVMLVGLLCAATLFFQFAGPTLLDFGLGHRRDDGAGGFVGEREVVVLVRHAERCDRSPALPGYPDGITVAGRISPSHWAPPSPASVSNALISSRALYPHPADIDLHVRWQCRSWRGWRNCKTVAGVHLPDEGRGA